MARPTDYTEDLLRNAFDYIESCPDVVPSVVGLCLHIGIAKSTCYRWIEEGNAEFKDIVDTVADLQERKLVSNGLTNEFNASITKLLLTKHGYSDKVESTNTNIEMSQEEWLDSLE
jgi:hypothetical protein